MDSLDRDITKAYFTMEEARRQRIRMTWLLDPEKYRPGLVRTETKQIRIEAMADLGFGQAHLEAMLFAEDQAKATMSSLAEIHPLMPYFSNLERISSPMWCGLFVAASGDIERPATVAGFWKGMGLDIVDGKAPRNTRGLRVKEGHTRRVACLPHVSTIGQQIRQQIIYCHGPLRQLYDHYKGDYSSRWVDGSKMRHHKAAIRASQKILYACLYEEWRKARHLPFQEPYAFGILHHNGDSRIRMADLFGTEPTLTFT